MWVCGKKIEWNFDNDLSPISDSCKRKPGHSLRTLRGLHKKQVRARINSSVFLKKMIIIYVACCIYKSGAKPF